MANEPGSIEDSHQFRQLVSDVPTPGDTPRHGAEIGDSDWDSYAEFVGVTEVSPDADVEPYALGEHCDDDGLALYERPKVVFSLLIRQRIRQAWVDSHQIAVQRIKDAHRQGDLASYHSIACEVRDVSEARRCGTASDRRAALLTLACSCVLLAEREDRQAEPKRGTKRASTERWKPIDFRVQ